MRLRRYSDRATKPSCICGISYQSDKKTSCRTTFRFRFFKQLVKAVEKSSITLVEKQVQRSAILRHPRAYPGGENSLVTFSRRRNLLAGDASLFSRRLYRRNFRDEDPSTISVERFSRDLILACRQEWRKGDETGGDQGA